MFKFITWELKDFFKKNYKFGIYLVILFSLTLLIPVAEENEFAEIVWVPMIITTMFLLIMMFYKGTLIVINTYRKKTFLLESMIAYSPAKLLLSKYLLAIIINIIYGFLSFIACAIITYKFADLNLLSALFDMLSIIKPDYLLRGIIYLVFTSVGFTSLITMIYIISKSINPSKRGTLFIGIIIWWIIIYLQNAIISEIIPELDLLNTSHFIINCVINLILITVYYLVSVKFIRDKLEIYS